jgi:hypothetical protein
MKKYIVELPDGETQKVLNVKGAMIVLKNGDIYDEDATMVRVFKKYFKEEVKEEVKYKVLNSYKKGFEPTTEVEEITEDISEEIEDEIVDEEDINTIEKDVIIEID